MSKTTRSTVEPSHSRKLLMREHEGCLILVMPIYYQSCSRGCIFHVHHFFVFPIVYLPHASLSVGGWTENRPPRRSREVLNSKYHATFCICNHQVPPDFLTTSFMRLWGKLRYDTPATPKHVCRYARIILGQETRPKYAY